MGDTDFPVLTDMTGRSIRPVRSESGPGSASATWVEAHRVSLENQEETFEADRPAGRSELRRLHQMMRGRYRLAAVLATLLAAAGGVAGFHFGHRLYSSTGEIRVMPVVPKVLYAVDEKGQLPAFDSFVEAQVSLMKSQRVTELAMQDPDWLALGREKSDAAIQEFMKTVVVSREEDLIQIQSLDPDPHAAVTEVRALVNAYQKIYDEQDAQSGERRLDVLQSLQTNRTSELAALRQRILDIARVYGSDDLKALYQFKQDTVNKLESTMADRQMELASATRANEDLPADPTPEQWSRYSSKMAHLLDDRDTYQRRIDEVLASDGIGSPVVQSDQKLIALADQRIQNLSDELKANRAAGWVPSPITSAATPTDASAPSDVGALQEDLQLLTRMHEKAQAEMVAIGQQELQIQELQAQVDQVKRERDDAEQRINQLNLEGTISGRINVISDGDRPLGTFKDTRILLCPVGIAGGALLGFGLVAGLAAMDPRLRSPDEAEDLAAANSASSILGILPRLPDDLSDPAQAALAAHCVHEVRTSLQLWRRKSRHRVFAVTSASAGAGKTSLTLALGVSFATAKLRTLIVDCDLVGCGLTARVDQIVTRRLGELLRDQGVLRDEQLNTALHRSRSTKRRLGEVLLEMGLVSDDDLAHAVSVQSEQRLGILDVLHGTPLLHCTAETGIPNLHFLSAGTATARDVPLLSSHGMQQLVEEMGQAFDVVLVDTGPVLGSLEAQLVSAVADGVIMMVTKGASRSVIGKAISQLNGLGAKVAGVVFNRASEQDVNSFAGSSTRVRPVSAMPPSRLPPMPSDPGRAAAFGPLAVAVAKCAPARSKTPNNRN